MINIMASDANEPYPFIAVYARVPIHPKVYIWKLKMQNVENNMVQPE
jgi:hypothetical protein